MIKRIIKYFSQRHRLPVISFLCLLIVLVSTQAILSSQRTMEVGYVSNISQIKQVPQKPQSPSTPKQDTKVIVIINAEEHLRRRGFEPRILMDSVVLLHDGAYLYCDSAYFYDRNNTFEAFGNVRMEQGDTLFLHGKYIHYDGNTKLVKVRKDVSLEHIPQGVTLFTDSLNYDRMMNIGYYFDGGLLVDSLNDLTSFWGQYEPSIKLATFKDSVVLENPKFTLYSDFLKYNTESKVATFNTPTTIVSDSGFIYTTNGWYNTDTEESLLLDRSRVISKNGEKLLIGDTIYYDKIKGFGEVFGNMFLQDTAKYVILQGHYGFYDENRDYAMATDSAFCIDYSQPDSLFIHADTLKLITIIDSVKLVELKKEKLRFISDSLSSKLKPDTISLDSLHLKLQEINSDSLQNIETQIDSVPTNILLPNILLPEPIINRDSTFVSEEISDSIPADSLSLKALTDSLDIKTLAEAFKAEAIKKDTLPAIPVDTAQATYRIIKAYYGVRFFRNDMQGVCDSLQLSSRDSILHMYTDPVLWTENRQLYGDTIDIFMNDSTIDRMHVKQFSFSIEQKDSLHFNQLKSRDLKIFFENKKVKRVFAEGNVETVAYPEERDGTLNGVHNWLESSYLEIFMTDGAFTKLVVWPKPVGKATPFHLLTYEQLRLKDFFWYDYIRPLDKDDIFRETKLRSGDVKPKRSAIFDRIE